MKIQTWIEKNTESLVGKTVVLSGSTGGLGRALAEHLASLGASLILLNRNASRTQEQMVYLSGKYGTEVEHIPLDASNMESVRAATEVLLSKPIDVLIHNAGAYDIPRCKTDVGFDNVFTINFLSPYYMTRRLMPLLQARRGRVVVVGSIAHAYSGIDLSDVDFSTRNRASLVYGNAKRYLTYALHGLFEKENEASLAIVHPGISFTGITDHYPPLIYALIKHPMKVIFMKPDRASLSILRGVFEQTPAYEWIGPSLFNVWGLPSKKRLTGASVEEISQIVKTAEELYGRL